MADITENILGMASQTAQREGQGLPEGIHAGAELAMKQQQLTQQRQQMQMKMQQLQMAQWGKAIKFVKDLDSVKDPKYKAAMAKAGPGYFAACGVQMDPNIEKSTLETQQGAAQFVALGHAVATGQLDFGLAQKLMRDPHGYLGLPQDQQMQARNAIEEAGGDPSFFDHALSPADQQTGANAVAKAQKEKTTADIGASRSAALNRMAATREEQLATQQHEYATKAVANDKPINAMRQGVQNLSTALSNFQVGKGGISEFEQLQQAIRTNTGISQTMSAAERQDAYMKYFGIDLAKGNTLLFGSIPDMRKVASQITGQITDVVNNEIANKQKFANQMIDAAASRNRPFYDNPAAAKYKAAFENTVIDQKAQFGLGPDGKPNGQPISVKPKADAAMVKKYLDAAKNDPTEHANRFNSLSNQYDLSDIDMDEMAQPDAQAAPSDESAGGSTEAGDEAEDKEGAEGAGE